jgi:hypothetical protein
VAVRALVLSAPLRADFHTFQCSWLCPTSSAIVARAALQPDIGETASRAPTSNAMIGAAIPKASAPPR